MNLMITLLVISLRGVYCNTNIFLLFLDESSIDMEKLLKSVHIDSFRNNPFVNKVKKLARFIRNKFQF